jgi:hypothetical protein
VDQHLISSSQPPAIKPVMGGVFVQQIFCKGHDFTSEREEDFYQISVDVKGMGSLQKSLDDYVKVRDSFVFLFCSVYATAPPLCVAVNAVCGSVSLGLCGMSWWLWGVSYQISVDVKGIGSLQKSLDDYVKVRLASSLRRFCVLLTAGCSVRQLVVWRV